MSESFGTLRHGTLLETPMYDYPRFMRLQRPSATCTTTEAWLRQRVAVQPRRPSPLPRA